MRNNKKVMDVRTHFPHGVQLNPDNFFPEVGVRVGVAPDFGVCQIKEKGLWIRTATSPGPVNIQSLHSHFVVSMESLHNHFIVHVQ